MEKEIYRPADLDVIYFESADIVTSSGGFDGENDEF